MEENRELSREAKYRLYCDERMAQQIRDDNQELRELDSRIRAAYVTKTLKAQLAEREKQRLQEKIRIENDIQLMKQKLYDDLQRERQRKEEIRLQQEVHRKELLQQIDDKQFKRNMLYEEFLKEKIIIDEIMAQIQKEQMEYSRIDNTNCAYYCWVLHWLLSFLSFGVIETGKFKKNFAKRNGYAKIFNV